MTDPEPFAEAPVKAGLAGEEHFRLVTGFADLFTAVVVATGFFAIAGLAGVTVGPLAGLVLAAAAWGLAVPLVRQRNFAACGIVLALGFTIGVEATLSAILGVVGALLGALASWQYWRVYKVPIAAAAAILTPVAVAGGLGTHMFYSFGPFAGSRAGGGAALFWGVIVFAIGMRWDIGDRLRQTRRSDVGFWLHLAAAPLIVHGAFAAMGLRQGYLSGGHLQPVLILFALLALVALIVDRRPILVSSLSYLAYAMSSVIKRGEMLGGAMMVALLLGGGVLVLAVGWNVIRQQLLRLVPAALAERLPPVASGRPVPQPETPLSEKEPLRLIFGFNDIFVAIGLCALIAGSVMFSFWQFVVSAANAPGPGHAASSLFDLRLVLAPAVVIWLAAEFFARYRRMALPSIQLAIAFAITAAFAGFIVAGRMVDPAGEAGGPLGLRPFLSTLPYPLLLQAAVTGSLVAAAANLLFWWRHKVPISLALALSCLLAPVFVDVWAQAFQPSFGAVIATTGVAWQYRAMLAGVIFFAIAMWFDQSDRLRQTRRSDTAFWLHFTASLVLLPALFSLLRGLPAGPWLVAGIFGLLILLAVATDRRAPVLVAMPFVIAAYAPAGKGVAPVALVVCILLVATTLFWDRLRDYLLRNVIRT